VARAIILWIERLAGLGPIDGRFTYMLRPGTALYFEYTDGYDSLRLDPSVNPALQHTSFPDLTTSRQVFVKLSYLFRF
jgi:hypothetical protein